MQRCYQTNTVDHSYFKTNLKPKEKAKPNTLAVIHEYGPCALACLLCGPCMCVYTVNRSS